MIDELLLANKINERQRVSELERYNIVGTPSEHEFNDVAEIAAYIAGCDMAYISFVDETSLWFKATHGFEATKLPRRETYCQFVIESGKPVAIPDTENEERYIPESMGYLARQIKFYVGVPLRSLSGHILGTLCVVDKNANEVPPKLISMLEKLADQVTTQLEIRRINRILIEERDTFSILFEAAPTPLILVENDNIVRGNYAFAGVITDADAESLVGRRLSQYIAGVPDEPGISRETTITDIMGKTTPVIVALTRLHKDHKTYDLVSLTDISDRKEKERVMKEQQLAAENANRIKDTFLSLVSHDLRSPLSGISTMLELLDTSGNTFTPEEWKSTIRDLREATAVLVEMLNQLLNIHRIRSGRIEVQRESVSLFLIAQQVVLSLSKQIKDKDIEVIVDIPESAFLDVDIGLFREALFNLVSNAIKFSTVGGAIRISHNDSIVWVEDDGIGVTGEDLPNLFRHEIKTSRIGTSGERGTGLGLPLVMDIMKAHGGTIYYDREYSNGARFVLDFSGDR